jgi:lysophospholipase L1-like esterase
MALRALPPALFAALLLACSTASSTSDEPSTSTSPTDRSGDGGTGPDASSDPGPLADGGANADGDAPTEPGPPHIQLIGRFDTTEPGGARCAYAGCRIVARFEGTRVSAKLKEEYFTWMEAAPGEWDVIIDGATTEKLVMPAEETTFALAQGLPAGVHTVELYRRTEPQTGTTQFGGFDFGDGVLLAPPVRKTRRIEIVGDSSSTGYGVEGVGMTDAEGKCPGVNHAAKWQNFRKAYGAVLGDLVDAEVFGTSLSGKGIFQNGWHPDKQTIPILFSSVLPMETTSGLWDFTTWQPDVVVVMAGGNDFAIGKPVDEGPATPAEFTEAYRQFAATLRGVYPQAHLVLTLSPTTDDAEPPGSNTRTNIANGAQTVVTERNGQGDAKVHYFAPNKAPKSEMTGCFGHGSPELHQRVANELAAFIKPKLGW